MRQGALMPLESRFMQSLFARCVKGASVPALKPLEIRFMQGLFARCVRVLQYQL